MRTYFFLDDNYLATSPSSQTAVVVEVNRCSLGINMLVLSFQGG